MKNASGASANYGSYLISITAHTTVTTYGTIGEFRAVYYNATDNAIQFSDNRQVYTGSAQSVSNSMCKPLYIYGIK